MIWVIFIIIFLVAFGPILWAFAKSCIAGVIYIGLIIISAPIMWIVIYFCERQQRRIRNKIDLAIQNGEDRGHIYYLEMQYRESEERQETITNVICTTISLSAFIFVILKAATII